MIAFKINRIRFLRDHSYQILRECILMLSICKTIAIIILIFLYNFIMILV